MDGLFTENGPFRVWSDGQTVSVVANSCNTLADVLYLESPVGVGYSYSTENRTLNHTDDTTTRMNLIALQDFFRKFPQFKGNPFYIAGESYGGVYAYLFNWYWYIYSLYFEAKKIYNQNDNLLLSW